VLSRPKRRCTSLSVSLIYTLSPPPTPHAPSSCSAASTSGPRLATDETPVRDSPRQLCPSNPPWLWEAWMVVVEMEVEGRGGGSLMLRSVATKGLGCGRARRGLGERCGPVWGEGGRKGSWVGEVRKGHGRGVEVCV
jgi:hypothetical protein